MDQLEVKEAKELNKLLGEKLSEAYKEIAKLRANNAHQDKCNADVVADLQKNLESEKEKSKKFQRKIAVLRRKLSDKKREKTELRIELNRTKIEHRIRSKIRRASKIQSTSTVSNSEWSTEESLKNSISNQANIKPQNVFKVSAWVVFLENDNLLSREFMPIHSGQLIWAQSLVRLDW